MKFLDLDPHDDATLREWWEVEQAVHRHDRRRPSLKTYGALASSWRNTSPYFRGDPFMAVLDGRIVGLADLGYSTGDNEHLAQLEVSVLPSHRRRGIGRALHEEATVRRRAQGRTHAMGEAYTPVDGEGSPGLAFTQSLGYVDGLGEHHLVLDLPAAAGPPPSPAEAGHEGYEVVTWTGKCPDDLVEGYLEMRNRMNADVPAGDLDYTPTTLDLARLRLGEERLAPSYEILVAAARRADGVMGGYSLTFLPHGSDEALQDDTLVMPDHRGRHLGLALKRATLRIVQCDHAERTAYHSSTDPQNVAIYRTNVSFGYVRVEAMHDVQISD